MFAALVRDAKRLRVVDVVEKEDRKQRPAGLNTVEMLKVGGCQVSPGMCVNFAFTVQAGTSRTGHGGGAQGRLDGVSQQEYPGFMRLPTGLSLTGASRSPSESVRPVCVTGASTLNHCLNRSLPPPPSTWARRTP